MVVGEGELVVVAEVGDFLGGGVGFFFFDAGIAADVESLCGQREASAGIFHHIHDAEEQVFADGGEFVELAREDVRKDFDIERRACNVDQADAHALCFDPGMAVEELADF